MDRDAGIRFDEARATAILVVFAAVGKGLAMCGFRDDGKVASSVSTRY